MPRILLRLVLRVSVGCVFSAVVSAQTSPPSLSASPGELTLDGAIAAALARNPIVDRARAAVAAAEGSRLTATTFPNPVVTYWVENSRFSGSGAPMGLDRETSAYATLPLEPFLQRSSRTAHAAADVRAAQADVTSAERRVALDVAHAFYRIALAQASIDAARDNSTNLQQLVDYLRTRVAQGASPEGEMIRAEVERDRSDTEVTLAEVELLRAQAALRPLLGAAAMQPGVLRVATPDVLQASSPLPPFPDFSTRALAQRPELLRSRAQRDAAVSAIAVERSLVMRQLGASFGVKRTAGTNAMVGGLSLTIPLFDRNRGEIQRATAEQLAAEQEVQWLERVVIAEVDATYQSTVRLVAQVNALRPAFLRRAEESRRIVFAAYQEGAAPLTSVLDANRALTDARVIYARALVAANESVFELAIASGYDARSATTFGGSR